jgi:hypothetical protein
MAKRRLKKLQSRESEHRETIRASLLSCRGGSEGGAADG